MAQTLKGNLSHINDFRVYHGKKRVNWLKKYPRLAVFIKIINTLKPPGIKSEPITLKIMSYLENLIDKKSWTLYTAWVAFVLAYSWACRSCEYSKTTDYDAPKLNAIKFEKTNEGNSCITYSFNKSKTNQIGKVETLAAVCCCPSSICVYCTLAIYLKYRVKLQKYIPKRYNQYLFLIESSVRIKLNSKKKYNFIYYHDDIKCKEFVPLQASSLRNILHDLLKRSPVKNWKEYNLHGFRYGGITDLAALGLSETLLKGISRHAHNSPVLYRYIRLTPKQVASLVQKAKKQRER